MSAAPPVQARRRTVLALLGPPLLGVTACATRPPMAESALHRWSGRLSLVIASDPPQQFHSGFDLTGNEQRGEFSLSSPLGSILAILQWRPGQAVLLQNGQTHPYPSVDALVAAVTGTPVPLRALFSWLRGVPEEVAGWHVDLSGLPDGRLLARRVSPLPTAELRVILDRS